MSYAIIRIKKLKAGNVHGSSSHVTRSRETPNADSERTQLNQTMIGAGLTPAEAISQRVGAVKEARQESGARGLRSDAIHAVEHLLTASPEYFAGMTPEKVEKWAQHSLDFLRQKYGDGVVHATLHLDETTPHIHAYHVPEALDGQGRPTLSAKQFYGSRKLLGDLQTEYAEHMQQLAPELKRGQRRAVPAKHQEVKRWYGEQQRIDQELAPLKAPDMAVPEPPPMMRQASRAKWAEDQTRSQQDRTKRLLRTARRGLADRQRLLASRGQMQSELKRWRAMGLTYREFQELRDQKSRIEQAADDLDEIHQTAKQALQERDELRQELRQARGALNALSEAVGIDPDQALEKSGAIGRIWKRDVQGKFNRRHDLN